MWKHFCALECGNRNIQSAGKKGFITVIDLSVALWYGKKKSAARLQFCCEYEIPFYIDNGKVCNKDQNNFAHAE